MTTLQAHKFTCPLCGNTFDSQLIMSTNSMGKMHSDFYKEAAGAQPVCYFVHTCTNCGYTGFEGDFQPESFTDEFRRLVSETITPEVKGRKIDVNGNFFLAALCAEWRGATPQTLARIYHMGAWCSRLRGDKDKEKFYLGKAVEYFEKALESGVEPPENKAIFTYIVGDIYRRLGDAEKAGQWYGKVEQTIKETGGDPKILEFARRQMSEPSDFF